MGPVNPSRSASPFFVVGCGRSGTTLLRTMLNRHSQVAIPLESLFIVDYLQAKESLSIELLIRTMVREYELYEWGIEVSECDLIGASDARTAIERLHEVYLSKLGKHVWGQKTPRFVGYGDVLKRAWPHAKFVHVVRDPRAVVSSLIRSDVHRSNALFASKRWLRDVSAGLGLADKYPGDVLLVRYEDLVRAPEATLRRVCVHLGLDYEPALIVPRRQETRDYSSYYASIHALLDKPPDPDRIDLWRTSLGGRQLQLVEYLCSPLLERLGYDLVSGASAPKALRSYKMVLVAERGLGFAFQVAKSLSKRTGYLASYARRKIVVRGLATGICEGIAIRKGRGQASPRSPDVSPR